MPKVRVTSIVVTTAGFLFVGLGTFGLMPDDHEVRLDVSAVSFGHKPAGVHEETFSVTNRSSRAVFIERASVSCSCIKVRIAQQLIKPGGSILGTVVWDGRASDRPPNNFMLIVRYEGDLFAKKVKVEASLLNEYLFDPENITPPRSGSGIQAVKIIPVHDNSVKIESVSVFGKGISSGDVRFVVETLDGLSGENVSDSV